jgi:hypothetical protein
MRLFEPRDMRFVVPQEIRQRMESVPASGFTSLRYRTRRRKESPRRPRTRKSFLRRAKRSRARE